MNIIKLLLPYLTHVFWIAIVIMTIWAWNKINKLKKEEKLDDKRHFIEMTPSMISTLGVLGTFLGITLGLLCFNSKDLQTSIPDLLNGLKTAFLTSLAGMFGSLILSKRINKIYDEEKTESDINKAAGQICKAVSSLEQQSLTQNQAQTAFYNILQQVVQSIDRNLNAVNAQLNNLNTTANNLNTAANNSEALLQNVATDTDTMTQIIPRIESSVGQTNTLIAASTATLHSSLESIDNTSNSIVSSVGNIEEKTSTTIESLNSINEKTGTIIDHTEAIATTEDDVASKIQSLTDKLHAEVIDIEDKMADTNQLLEKKFDEFSELLKKNNTEALVEVMKKVTEEFQKQMNALITKLVQENFDQLNKSVENLNVWQKENKEMIKSLTAQYKQMAENFEGTSTTLNKVKDDTKSLVSEGGKLDTLVNSLNEVIVKDEKFKSISSNLQTTADLTKSNMESFDKSTRTLNEWIKKQRDFRDSVTVLIQKLEEINEMRDYASTFWKETKKGMNEAVGIVKDGSTHLNQQLTRLDQQFYQRLSTTLSELDSCIQALVENSSNRR